MMKPLRAIFALLFLISGQFALAAAAVEIKPAAKLSPLAVEVDNEITNLEKQFIAVAEAMPADKFGVTPETLSIPGGAFKGVRTFAVQVRHVAADNFAIWAPVLGEAEPAGIQAPNGPPEMISREEVLKFLKDSFAYSHKAVARLTAENELEPVEFRGRKVTRMYLVLLAMSHANDHYGQMVEYLRMYGTIPPGSR
jgi:DinB superfamily